jgi:hypothetical protein
MTGDERQCDERSSRQASGRDVSRHEALASVHHEVQALCRDSAEPDTQADSAKDGLPEKAFAPANQRRLVRHLLALHAGDAGLPSSHLDDRAPSPQTWQAER